MKAVIRAKTSIKPSGLTTGTAKAKNNEIKLLEVSYSKLQKKIREGQKVSVIAHCFDSACKQSPIDEQVPSHSERKLVSESILGNRCILWTRKTNRNVP